MDDGAWIHQTFDISALADGQPAVYIRWSMGPTDGSVTYCGWNIDDVAISFARDCPITPTPTLTPSPTLPPTDTPAPTDTPRPTDSPVPSATAEPTVAPTETAAPTFTPTAEPTTVPPTFTPTPVPTGPATATPVVTETATPVPPCDEFTVELSMPSHHYTRGDACSLTASLCSPQPQPIELPVFVVLDVYGAYWFAPGWRAWPDEGIDYYARELPPGVSGIDVIPQFEWPEVEGTAAGIFFYGAILDATQTQLMGQLAAWEFGYGE